MVVHPTAAASALQHDPLPLVDAEREDSDQDEPHPESMAHLDFGPQVVTDPSREDPRHPTVARTVLNTLQRQEIILRDVTDKLRPLTMQLDIFPPFHTHRS